MKILFTSIIVVISTVFSSAQSEKDWMKGVLAYQEEMNRELTDTAESPLPPEELAVFDGVDFYVPNIKFKVSSFLILTPESKPFEMPTSSERKPIYRRYAMAVYTLDTLTDTLDIYQNLTLIKQKGYEDYLFVPFSDLTNGFETYGGGRYLDLRIPEGDTLVIDFNMAYNPYCVYNYKYSCPIPPRENFINYEITAGVKNYSPE
jgi:uncharacterized protein (DUF1684 family)